MNKQENQKLKSKNIMASAGFEPTTCSRDHFLQCFWDLDAESSRLHLEEELALFCWQNG
jgi:hypothetical protein